MVAYDPLWKGIIEDLLPDFLVFFFPNEKFDLSINPEFLDKELDKIYTAKKDSEHSLRVDKLIKLHMLDGKERLILIHVEVQGYRQKALPTRIFKYFNHLMAKHGDPLTSFVIFTDNNPGYKPDTFYYEVAGTKLTFQYKAYKVLDQSEEALKASDNIFSIVIRAVLLALKRNKMSGDELVLQKTGLIKDLLKHKVERHKIESLFTYIDLYVKIKNDKLNQMFDKQVKLITGKKSTMGVKEALLEYYAEQGLQQGLQQGREEQLYEVVKKMVLKGKDIVEICDLLDVNEKYVLKVRSEIFQS